MSPVPAATSAPSSAAPRTAPGPRGYPLLGILPRIWRDPLRFFEQVALECGDVARMGVGRFTLHLISGPELIGRILLDRQENYWKGEGLAAARLVMGNGLATSEGELWARQRRCVQPALNPGRALSARSLDELIDRALDDVAGRARSGRPFDLAETLRQLTLRIMYRLVFGEDPSAARVAAVCRAVVVATEHIDHSAWRWIPIPDCVPTPRQLRFRRALARLDAAVHSILDERRKRGSAGRGLLDELLSWRDEQTGEAMSDRQIRDEIVTLFIAGHETPANSLAWTFHLLSNHADCERRVLDEVRAGFGPRVLASADGLPHTNRVLHESMRLYPPAWILVRTPREDDELDGFHIPAGSPLLLSPYVVHRHPGLWEDPTRFDPDRWLPERVESHQPFQYFPFGGGSRTCAGKALAMAMMKQIVAMTVRRFALRPAPRARVVPRAQTTLRPAHGVRVTATER